VRGSSRARAVSLTFDDGPHPVCTPILLDRLAARNIAATFFLVGEQAAQYPELVRRIVEEGHEFGHHSYTHGNPALTSAKLLANEVRKTEEVFASQEVGVSHLVRPPHGEFTVSKLAALWRLRKTVVLWSVDPQDFVLTAPEPLREWANTWQPTGGDVVLLHDNHPWAEQAIDAIADQVHAAGLSFRTISRMLLDPA
jgi:peptidoglycan/xylan/chitin deacetylase (PgdA/CDA1 family)